MKQFGWQVVGCSMPEMQRQERHGHQELVAALTGQQASLVLAPVKNRGRAVETEGLCTPWRRSTATYGGPAQRSLFLDGESSEVEQDGM